MGLGNDVVGLHRITGTEWKQRAFERAGAMHKKQCGAFWGHDGVSVGLMRLEGAILSMARLGGNSCTPVAPDAYSTMQLAVCSPQAQLYLFCLNHKLNNIYTP